MMRGLRTAYKLRWKRRRLLFRALRKRREIRALQDNTNAIRKDDILCFCTFRNEEMRLPYFLKYYRDLGVDHFIFVDNDSDDGSLDLLLGQDDISIWHTKDSYRLSRFGMDWLGWLQLKFAHGHWALTVDADELLVYADHESTSLKDLSKHLESNDISEFGCLMLDMYPKGRLGETSYVAGQDPMEVIPWFDAQGYDYKRQEPMWNLWVQGGVRERVFFADEPRKAPTLNKIPFVKWNKQYVYVNSTHSMLPRKLNLVQDYQGSSKPCGVLLHTKFLPSIVEKSAEEKERKEHFNNSAIYEDYYDGLISDPVLWNEASVKYENWQQFVSIGWIIPPKTH